MLTVRPGDQYAEFIAASANRDRLEAAFQHLAEGNGREFVALMAEDFRWTIKGTTAWSRTYEGKTAVIEELLGPLMAQFSGRYRNTAQRMVAEDDFVVVQCQGNAETKAGARYDNEYCYVCRFEGGELRELVEYLDTALVDAALAPPPA
jgi:ketosteroid isomerase-like protein